MRTKRSVKRLFAGRVRKLVAIAASACLVGGGAAGLVLGSAAPASADTQGPINFESGYTLGTVNGQDGWTSTGAYDQAIVDDSTIAGAPASFQTKSLRISDAVTSNSFGDQTYSKPTVDAAGEPTADAGVYPTGTLQNHFDASFDFASVTPGAEQPGLHMSVSPDRGDGARMSYVRIEDSPTGWNLFFDDYQDVAPLGSPTNLDDGCGTGDDFTDTQIASGVDRSVPHNLRFVMNLLPGGHNDIVSVLLDGTVIHTGTSWEDYYRYCAESGGGTGGPLADQSRIVRNLELRESGTADPSNAGNGFLIDNMEETTAQDCTTTCYVDGTTGNDANTGQSGDPLQTVQTGVNIVQAGGTVSVAAGTYTEQLLVSKAVTITGAGQASTTIQGPAALNDSPCVAGARAVVMICGSPSSTVAMSGVTISGGATGEDADASCGPQITGAYVSDAETFSLSQSTVTNVYNASGSGFWGCQQGIGIRAGSSALGLAGKLIADHVTVLDYQKGGIVADGPGSLGVITNSLVEGDQLPGLSAFIAMNGIQISRGASGVIDGTTVSGNQCDDATASPPCGADPLNNTQSNGILLYDPISGQSPVPAISVTHNTLTGNDAGIYTTQLTGTPTISGNTVTNRYVGIYVDEGTARVTNNQITNNGSTPFGVGVIAVQGDESIADTTATLSGNTISGNPTGVKVADVTADAFTTHITVQRNALTANPTASVDNEAASTVDGTCNWWGQSAGPATGQVTGTVTTAPWLITSNLSGNCLPVMTIGTATVPVVEGNSGTTPANLTVSLDRPSSQTVTAFWNTSNGTAGPGDYNGAFGIVSFAPGQTTQTITVNVNGDTVLEDYEYFSVKLSNPTNSILGNAQEQVEIRNDDKPTMTVSNVSVTEGGQAQFLVTLAQRYYQDITVSASSANGTAHAPVDYVAIVGKTITIPAGTTSKFVGVGTKTDGVTEPDETFTVTFTSGSVNNSPVTATGTILANNT